MATYVVLGNFTNQGIRSVKDSVKRAGAFKGMAQKAGASVKEVYWTLGQYQHHGNRRGSRRGNGHGTRAECRLAGQRPDSDAPSLWQRRNGAYSRKDDIGG